MSGVTWALGVFAHVALVLCLVAALWYVRAGHIVLTAIWVIAASSMARATWQFHGLWRETRTPRMKRGRR